MEQKDSPPKDKGAPGTDRPRTGSGPLSIELPPDVAVLAEARRLVVDRGTRMENFAVCAAQDPVLVIELLRVANAMYFSEGRPPLATVKTAAIRLGADVLMETLRTLSERPAVEDAEISRWLEINRVRCKRAAIVSTILSEALARPLSEECQVAGLLMFVGEMLAVMHLSERYTKLANEVSRSTLLYRISQDHKFNVETMGVAFLRRNGIPDGILAALDRESRIKGKDRALMKPICMAAGELVDAFDQNRLDKLAPGKTIPPKSALRILVMTEPQYLKIYERVAEFLFSFKLLEERKKEAASEQKAQAIPVADVKPAAVSTPSEMTKSSELQAVIDSILNEEIDEEADDAELSSAATRQPAETLVEELDESIKTSLSDFSLQTKSSAPKTVPRVERVDDKPAPTPKIHTQRGAQFLNDVSGMLTDAKSSEELLSQLLSKLVTPGPFEKAALIVVSQDRKKAIVVACRGPALGNGQTLSLDDQLNPLAQCLTRVQSFGRKENNVSPFGSRSFAVAPIDADHATPVALYADCGENKALTFEARRIFRNVVQILNEKLPTLPGGIPNELSNS